MQNNKIPIAKSPNEELKQVTYVAMQPGVDLMTLESVKLFVVTVWFLTLYWKHLIFV